jgi:hypothetical protein
MKNNSTAVSSGLNKEEKTQFLYLHRYFYGGATTFAAHLLYRLAASSSSKPNYPIIIRVGKGNRSERKVRDFGYGLQYQNVSLDIINKIKYPFITLFKDYYLHVLPKLYEGRYSENVVLVIHDHRDISKDMLTYVKKWKLVTIRKTVQEYLKYKYDLDSLFLYHPFYPYPVFTTTTPRKGAVSISRISFEKNTDIILKANRLLDESQSVKLYGCPSRMYVHIFLGGQKGDFHKYYCGKFERSFSVLSNILAQAKFVVDLTSLKHDGGGTQYTFLEAIHNGCALVLHRDWIDNRNVKPEYRDFKEGYNCFAVDNESELADLITKDPDTTKIVQNAKKLMHRHINVDWSFLTYAS